MIDFSKVSPEAAVKLAFSRSTHAYTNQISTGQAMITTDDFDSATYLTVMDDLVRGVVQSEDVLFPVEPAKTVKFIVTRLGRRVLNQIGSLKHHEAEIRKTFPIHRFTPYMDLFIRHVRENKLEELVATIGLHRGDELAGKVGFLNECIDGIRLEAKSGRFKKIINDHVNLSGQNYKSLVDYINGLFERYPRLLVLRVDFGYEKDGLPWLGHEGYVKYPEIKENRERFFSNRRMNKDFKHMVGYAWKIEFGIRKGFHLHTLLFFNADRVSKDVYKAMQIGKYWNTTITKGTGTFYSCNAVKNEYINLGIGLIRREDGKLRENLLVHVAQYLTKTDYFAKIVAPEIGRTFGKGLLPKERKPGRPVKKAEPCRQRG